MQVTGPVAGSQFVADPTSGTSGGWPAGIRCSAPHVLPPPPFRNNAPHVDGCCNVALAAAITPVAAFSRSRPFAIKLPFALLTPTAPLSSARPLAPLTSTFESPRTT